jgi:hypothetical protein
MRENVRGNEVWENDLLSLISPSGSFSRWEKRGGDYFFSLEVGGGDEPHLLFSRVPFAFCLSPFAFFGAAI